MYEIKLTPKERIVEHLVLNQEYFKKQVDDLKAIKNALLNEERTHLRRDLEEQYDARIKQDIAFITANALGIPSEYVIVLLEEIDLKEYLNI